MSWLAEEILITLNRLIPQLRMHAEWAEAKRDEERHFQREYAEALPVYEDFARYNDLRGCRVLDVGSGSGAKAMFYARQGARDVVGLDLNLQLVERARSASVQRADSQEGSTAPRFVVGDAAAMPFSDDTFDAVIAVHTLEHVDDPWRTLNECARVVRRGGRVLLRFPPYHSAWAAHLDSWIRLPWCQVLFSERTLINVVNRLEASQRLNEGFAEFARLDLRGLESLPHVNKLTLREFEAMVRDLPLREVQLKLLPVAYRFLAQRAAEGIVIQRLSARALALTLRALASVPLLQELVVTKIVCVLEK